MASCPFARVARCRQRCGLTSARMNSLMAAGPRMHADSGGIVHVASLVSMLCQYRGASVTALAVT
jgi:hypothetical protein